MESLSQRLAQLDHARRLEASASKEPDPETVRLRAVRAGGVLEVSDVKAPRTGEDRGLGRLLTRLGLTQLEAASRSAGKLPWTLQEVEAAIAKASLSTVEAIEAKLRLRSAGLLHTR